MRALAPLPALLLLAAAAAACPFGYPGHVHTYAASSAPSVPLPEGRCAGRGQAPASAPAAVPAKDFDLRAHPIPSEHRSYWEMIGYRFDDAAGSILDSNGSALTEALMVQLERPFDASYERIPADVWMNLMLSGYRLDEETCRLIDPDGAPFNNLSIKIWSEMNRRNQSHAALETLLAKLRGLDAEKPVPDDIRKRMLTLAQAGTALPPTVLEILARNGATVGQLRAPAAAAYADSTKFFDGKRPLADVVRAAIPAGSESGVASRRKAVPDPNERALGRALAEAFNAEISKTAPGRELLSHFSGQHGEKPPDVMVLKLTQNPNDLPLGAVYDYTSDRMIINHWSIIRTLHSRLPPEKFTSIEGRLGDAKQLSKLLDEDPSLLNLIVDDEDTLYFHELTHAAQTHRDRIDDEVLRRNLPSANPLSKEHEAHRAHCRYLLSKDPAAVDRSNSREYCLDLIRDPDAFKDRVTSMYLSAFSGSSTLDDVGSRQDVRRETSHALAAEGGIKDWLEQKLKQFGLDLGDTALAKYRIDVDKRETEFLAALPELRREEGGALISYYEKTGAAQRALALVLSLPAGSLGAGTAPLRKLTDDALAWVVRDADPAHRDERLAAISLIAPRLKAAQRDWPASLSSAYERDALSLAEEFLAKALTLPPEDTYKRAFLLEKAGAWTESLRQPGDLPARIESARRRPQ